MQDVKSISITHSPTYPVYRLPSANSIRTMSLILSRNESLKLALEVLETKIMDSATMNFIFIVELYFKLLGYKMKPEKMCKTCGKPFTWRKKWRKDWENVLYCSERCKRNKN